MEAYSRIETLKKSRLPFLDLVHSFHIENTAKYAIGCKYQQIFLLHELNRSACA